MEESENESQRLMFPSTLTSILRFPLADLFSDTTRRPLGWAKGRSTSRMTSIRVALEERRLGGGTSRSTCAIKALAVIPAAATHGGVRRQRTRLVCSVFSLSFFYRL